MSTKDYFEALDRILSGNPRIVSKYCDINNDQVAIEAGRKRGSIKKSRLSHAKLIAAIEAAKNERKTTGTQSIDKFNKQKKLAISYKEKYHSALNREVMYLNKIASYQKSTN